MIIRSSRAISDLVGLVHEAKEPIDALELIERQAQRRGTLGPLPERLGVWIPTAGHAWKLEVTTLLACWLGEREIQSPQRLISLGA